METLRLALLLGAVVPFAAACGGPTVPLSAQAGSSIVIPLTGDAVSPVGTIGFGSELIEDHQRGRLVFRLSGPGTELRTRATAAVRAARANASAGNVQIVSLVDIPADSPVGTFEIDVARRFRDLSGVVQETPIPYQGAIAVLPHELDYDCDQIVDRVGTPTPLEMLREGQPPFPIDSLAQTVLVQKPELVLALSRTVQSLEFELDVPPGVIVVERVAPAIGKAVDNNLAWQEETAPGRVTAAVVAQSGFERVAVAFSLVDGASQILDPASVSVTIRSATDGDGVELPTVVVASAIR